MQIELGPGIFAGAALITTATAELTVSVHAIRTARANPLERPRYE